MTNLEFLNQAKLVFQVSFVVQEVSPQSPPSCPLDVPLKTESHCETVGKLKAEPAVRDAVPAPLGNNIFMDFIFWGSWQTKRLISTAPR